VSADGRTVNFGGEIFSFTPTEARAFQILHEAYMNGTPDISETYIIGELGYEKGRVKDIFKRVPNWQKLIGKGKNKPKDTFRLNIDV
jgi:hypothetical protein